MSDQSEGQKDFLTASLLSMFVGWLGIDRFYLGYTKSGLLKLFTLGGLGVWTLIDIILIFTGSLKSANGQPLANRKKNLKPALIVAGVLLLLGAPFMLVGGLTSNTSTTPKPTPAPVTQKKEETTPQPKEEPKKEAKFDGSIVSYEAVNPATLQFVARVKNTGEAEGKFSCTVRGNDPSSTYRGFDFFEDESTLKPGKSKNFNGVLTITKEGAVYVTDVTISC